MIFFRSPAAFHEVDRSSAAINFLQQQWPSFPTVASHHQTPLPPHSSHPNLPHLAMLVFEAVLEVVCVSLPGYIVARQGLFTAEMQKFTANLNVALFTPCLVFTKLASQLTADKLVDLAIIPAIFVVQTLVSFLCAWGTAKAFGFSRRPRNFVIAMGVFGNSNSLPISLVLSLSKTIKGLHWDKVPNDNDDEVAARGILYLLIFQQLGQLVRWSWGYNVLLAPAHEYEDTSEHENATIEAGGTGDENQALLGGTDDEEGGDENNLSGSDATRVEDNEDAFDQENSQNGRDLRTFESGEQTPITHQQTTSSASSSRSSRVGKHRNPSNVEVVPTPTNGNALPTRRKRRRSRTPSSVSDDEPLPEGVKAFPRRCRIRMQRSFSRISRRISKASSAAFHSLPVRLQRCLAVATNALRRFFSGVWDFMNPPLWAMLFAVVVASVPELQRFFFTRGTFVRNSVTSAIESNAGVAVPLILVVLGGNLAKNTLPKDAQGLEDRKEETKLLIASIVSRMVLPFIIMAPALAVTAKFVPVSILDDPIFVIVCFLITGAPSALQLAQICQINNVYMGAISRLLFQSYVVWILPSTLVLVMTALEVVEWAQR